MVLIIVIGAAALFFGIRACQAGKKTQVEERPYVVGTGDIRISISATGRVQPQNRLEIKPPLAGRMEQILVREGQKVTRGQALAYMSSNERAALLDAARAKGEKELKEWENIYKPIPLVAPLNGTVIVRAVEPGQSVSASEAVIVLSDRLIVKTQVDETDIGKIKEGQAAEVTLDAYQDTTVRGGVNHIYHESRVVSNVTVYEVDVLPEQVPDFFRSGMSANVRLIQKERKGVLVVPVSAVMREKRQSFVMKAGEAGKNPVKTEIETGISDDDYIEVLSGLSEGDRIMVRSTGYFRQSRAESGSSPFMPQRRTGGTRR